QAGALCRRAPARPEPEVRRAGPRADGDAHPPRARDGAAAGPGDRGARLRGRAAARRGGLPRAGARAARDVDVQLRPQRGGRRPGDRRDRRRARGGRRAAALSAGPPASATAVGPRRRLFRWAGWFGLAHAALLGIVGLRYLWYYRPVAPAGWAYAA